MTTSPTDAYCGFGLMNLANDLERRLSGSSAHEGLVPELATTIPVNPTYVVVVIDGLGTHQLNHERASSLAGALRADLLAPFPTTTTVSLASLSTGRPPSEHGVIGHALWLPAIDTVMNTIHFTTMRGASVDVDPSSFLPGPNLWRRLALTGTETVVVQPANFAGSSLTRMLYGGARFEGYSSAADAVDITCDVASHQGRLVVLYLPFVDVAAHTAGQSSHEYQTAMALVDTIWSRLDHHLPGGATLIGTADHGHVDIVEERKIRLPKQFGADAVLFGDSRALCVVGDPSAILERVPGRWIDRSDAEAWWGHTPVSDELSVRLPDGIVLPDDGWAVFPTSMNDRLVGYHGGWSAEERTIPLLVRS